MHQAIVGLYIASLTVFVTCWLVGILSILRMQSTIRVSRESKPTLRELFGDEDTRHPARADARRFLGAMLFGALRWCAALAAGLGADILH
ncbi:hypothetical protein DVJ77_11340 [Dyella tabacisoli]|uniref:Uncharacterized protein n=1 Tax=Dyella tabacisoli TaxID=2282381 RepID=A0A369ULV8_9GAMM|nr:hypothetical protein DVJ77_11340 [Dyella tabacisoli]